MQSLICLLVLLSLLASGQGKLGDQCADGPDCGSNEQCVKIGNCPKGSCTCQTGFYVYGSSTNCREPGPKKLGEQCSTNEECYSLALLSSFVVECSTTCNCKVGFSRVTGTDYCTATGPVPTYANRTEQCSASKTCYPLTNLQCGTGAGTCDCPTDTVWTSVYPFTAVCLHRTANQNRISSGNTCTTRYNTAFFNSDAKVCTSDLDCVTCPGETTSKCGSSLPVIVGTGAPGTGTENPGQTVTASTTSTTRMPPGNNANCVSVAATAMLVGLLALLL